VRICDWRSRRAYHLGGYCFGGDVAYEMAVSIEAEAKSAMLAIMNCSRPTLAIRITLEPVTQ